MVTHVTLLVACHGQPAGAVTVKVVDPPAAGMLAETGEIVTTQLPLVVRNVRLDDPENRPPNELLSASNARVAAPAVAGAVTSQAFVADAPAWMVPKFCEELLAFPANLKVPATDSAGRSPWLAMVQAAENWELGATALGAVHDKVSTGPVAGWKPDSENASPKGSGERQDGCAQWVTLTTSGPYNVVWTFSTLSIMEPEESSIAPDEALYSRRSRSERHPPEND